MKHAPLIAILLGLAASAWLIAWVGAGQVAEAVMVAGFPGIAAITLFNVVPIAACGIAWRALIEPPPAHGTLLMGWVRFLRSTVSGLVPIGGELVAIRVMILHGIGGHTAGAATVVDMTLEMVTQLAFTALGLALLLLDGRDDTLAGWVLAGLGVAVATALVFLIAQRRGLFRWAAALPHRMAARVSWARLPELAGIDAEISAIYRRPRALLLGTLWHFIGWIVGAGEAWIALWFLNAPVSFSEVLILESLAFALRSTAFLVPAGIGVQEGGYVALGALFGLGPEVGLALSLLKRAREVLLAVPALLTWKLVELRAWRRRALATTLAS
ncbi:MAG TPA: lysylphosphatidylglycerol synthase domain-containing protein [Stellaceae bacterium]|nr:lysylphosphatidylglycerol synthase domain-containing protein [Stellaceae bacterium]